MKIADDTFMGNSECEWVNAKAMAFRVYHKQGRSMKDDIPQKGGVLLQ